MSKLALFGRPFVVFDAYNKDHRRWFAEFNKNSSWKNCPVRFVLDEACGDLVTQIQRQLIQYYVDKEFGAAKENLVHQKGKKTVDKRSN